MPPEDWPVENPPPPHQTTTRSFQMSHITTVTHHGSRGSGGAPASPDKPPASRRGLRHIGVVLAGSIVSAALLLVLANLAFAQSAQKKALPDLKPFLVEDIYPGETGSEPNWLMDFKGTLLFTADHPKFGEELWRSNGTKPGTRLLKDIDPGPLVINAVEDTETGSSAPDNVLRKRNVIYFQATTAKHGVELWKSDGTARGTTLVKDINTIPGNSNSNDTTGAVNRSAEVEKLFVVGKTLYFRANDGKRGVELWKSDGTRSGTKLLKDINLSSASTASDIGNLVALGKTLYFTANHGKHGVELWKSDGTRSGTTLLKDINAGPAGSDPDQLTAFGGVLLFTADDGVHGSEMWGSDGTRAGTTLLRDLEPGAVGSEPGGLTTSGRFLYFAASNPSTGEELWAVPTRGSSR